MPRKHKPLPRQDVYVDKRGRLTIPEYLRQALGIEACSWITVEAYPNLDNVKSLLVKKA